MLKGIRERKGRAPASTRSCLCREHDVWTREHGERISTFSTPEEVGFLQNWAAADFAALWWNWESSYWARSCSVNSYSGKSNQANSNWWNLDSLNLDCLNSDLVNSGCSGNLRSADFCCWANSRCPPIPDWSWSRWERMASSADLCPVSFPRAVAHPNPRIALHWWSRVGSFRTENLMIPASLTALQFPLCQTSSV